MKDSYKKIMKTHYRKMKKQHRWNTKITGNSTSKLDVLTEELFLTKQSEKKLKKENSDLTENTNLKKHIIMKLKNEKDILVSQIQTGQAEFDRVNLLLKEKVGKNEDVPVPKETEYQKKIADQTKLIQKLKEGKFNSYESKIKHLNIQLRQALKKYEKFLTEGGGGVSGHHVRFLTADSCTWSRLQAFFFVKLLFRTTAN